MQNSKSESNIKFIVFVDIGTAVPQRVVRCGNCACEQNAIFKTLNCSQIYSFALINVFRAWKFVKKYSSALFLQNSMDFNLILPLNVCGKIPKIPNRLRFSEIEKLLHRTFFISYRGNWSDI